MAAKECGVYHDIVSGYAYDADGRGYSFLLAEEAVTGRYQDRPIVEECRFYDDCYDGRFDPRLLADRRAAASYLFDKYLDHS